MFISIFHSIKTKKKKKFHIKIIDTTAVFIKIKAIKVRFYDSVSKNNLAEVCWL